MTENQAFAEWAILELMGHRRLAGYVTEQQIGGSGFLRIDIPSNDSGDDATQFYAPSAVYAITPTSEATARQVAQLGRPAPVQRWELPAAPRDIRDPKDIPVAGCLDDDDDPGF